MPGTKGKSGGRRPRAGRPLRPVPEQIDMVMLDTATPLPCSNRNFDNPDGICGKPATAAHAWPREAQWPTPGLWTLQPVCRECAAATSKVYEPNRGIAHTRAHAQEYINPSEG